MFWFFTIVTFVGLFSSFASVLRQDRGKLTRFWVSIAVAVAGFIGMIANTYKVIEH